MKHPIAITAFLLFIAVGLTETLRTHSVFAPKAYTEKSAYFDKLSPQFSPNVLLIGNSRTETNLNPEILDSIWGGHTHTLNFAFSSQELSDHYFQYVDTLINSNDSFRMICLNLSSPNMRVYQFRKNRFNSPFERNPYTQNNDDLLFSIQKMQKDDFPFFSKNRNKPKEIYHKNGWREIQTTHYHFPREIPIRDTDKVVALEQKMNAEARLFLKRWIQHWNQKGIVVVCYQAPTDTYTLRYEKNAGYTMEETRDFMRSLGAVWLDLPQTKYMCFDHSHLCADSALLYSHDFANMLQKELERKGLFPTRR